MFACLYLTYWKQHDAWLLHRYTVSRKPLRRVQWTEETVGETCSNKCLFRKKSHCQTFTLFKNDELFFVVISLVNTKYWKHYMYRGTKDKRILCKNPCNSHTHTDIHVHFSHTHIPKSVLQKTLLPYFHLAIFYFFNNNNNNNNDKW